MEYIVYKDIEEFAKDVMPYIEGDEAKHNLLIGNMKRELDGGKPNDIRVTIKDYEGNVVLIGVQVNPFKLVLAEGGDEVDDYVLNLLVEGLLKEKFAVPGCIAEEKLARRFAVCYARVSGVKLEDALGLNLLTLHKVQLKDGVEGKMRLATKLDLHYLPFWARTFSEECGIENDTIENYYTRLEAKIEKEEMYIWEDGEPVSVCMTGRKGMTGVAITFVYTPPYYRGRGYASGCVGEASQYLLDKGFKQCYLFADIKNPISNKIYTNLGYEMQGVTQEINFVENE